MPNGTTYERREKFCQLVFLGKQHVEARALAGYSTKCCHRTQVESAKKMMRHPWIKARLAELRQKTEDKSVATVKECKQVLTEIIRGRVSHYLSGNRINATLQGLNSAAVQEVVTSEIQIGKGDDAAIVDVTKLKLRDPVAAIAELNKMDHVYEPEKGGDTYNTQYNIIVQTPNGQAMLQRVLAGERTEKELPANGN